MTPSRTVFYLDLDLDPDPSPNLLQLAFEQFFRGDSDSVLLEPTHTLHGIMARLVFPSFVLASNTYQQQQ